MKRSPLALLAAALVTVAAAGCGSSAAIDRTGTLQVAVTEYRIIPQDARVAPGVLTIVVHNAGRLSHNLVISRGGVVEAFSPPVAPGQWTELQTALAPGRYRMASWVLSDRALGAYGTLDIGGR